MSQLKMVLNNHQKVILIPNGDNDFDMFCDLGIDDDFPIETTPDETNLLKLTLRTKALS